MKFSYHDSVLVLTHDEQILEGIFLRTEGEDFGQIDFGNGSRQYYVLGCIYPNRPQVKVFLENWIAERKAAKKKWDDLYSKVYEIRNMITRGEV